MKEEVKLIAIDKRYKMNPYPFRCVLDEKIQTYRTGQHIVPDDPSTYGNLTLREMTDVERLSDEKKARFPYIINPLNRINLYNGQKFDISRNKHGEYNNYKDIALLNMIRKEAWIVAPSKDKVIPRKHYFYLFDENYEAKERLVSSELAYHAEKYIREEVTEQGLRDIALLLNYKIKEFSYVPESTSNVLLKDKIIQFCKTKSAIVLECKDPGSRDDLYILKLAFHNIITQRGTDFYDGSEFIGKDINAVKTMMRLEENNLKVSKWNRLLAEKESRITATAEDALAEKRNALFNEIGHMTLEELQKFSGSKKYARVEWADISDRDALIRYLLKKVK